ncbi:hypothetical protein ES703_93091 [subsurface metagenome]
MVAIITLSLRPFTAFPTIFGGTQIGWGKVDDRVSLKTMAYCFELGINFIDTADSYGKGHSEEIVGKAVKGRRESVIIATKCGNFEDEQGRWVQLKIKLQYTL